jgi:hypothetical protein
MIAGSIMDKEDLKARAEIGNSSTDLLEILQYIELCRNF